MRSDVPHMQQSSSSHKTWVDPGSLPNHGDISTIGGNASDYVKQLNLNTYMSYGVGNEDTFGYKVGKSVRFVDISVEHKEERKGKLEAITIAELIVTKDMLNGAGMLHGGCVAYLIDNCCSTPLVVLGLVNHVNGVGVTQSMSIFFHAPAPMRASLIEIRVLHSHYHYSGTSLRIISTSIALGGRVMSSRCEIIDQDKGRMIASAILNKMQPAKL